MTSWCALPHRRPLTRPPLGALSPRLVIGTTRPGNLQASSGNPDLKPFKSRNVDFSLEWYYQENGYSRVGVFYKEVENFLVNTVENCAPFRSRTRTICSRLIRVFEVSLLDNLEERRVKGMEVGVQHSFEWLPGLLERVRHRRQRNARGQRRRARTSTMSRRPSRSKVSGDSYNVIGFYERGRSKCALRGIGASASC